MPPADIWSVRTKAAAWQRTLQAVPHRNLAATVERPAEGTARVTVHRPCPRWMVRPLQLLLGQRYRRTFEMGGLGLRLWEWCDGKRPMAELVDRLAAEQRLSYHEARILVTEYVRDLTQRGILALAVPREATAR